MSKKAVFEIESCKDCTHIDISRDYTSDSFEFCEKWDCDVLKISVRRYVDWHDKVKFIHPDCPYLKKDKKKEKPNELASRIGFPPIGHI
jgi:hypothetical protein